MVVAHSVERLLPTPKIPGSNPIIGNFIYLLSIVLNCIIEKTEMNKKEAGNGLIFLEKRKKDNQRERQI